ncbi:MAG: hypothetical protein WCD13_25005 [Pseudolabrys sp.]
MQVEPISLPHRSLEQRRYVSVGAAESAAQPSNRSSECPLLGVMRTLKIKNAMSVYDSQLNRSTPAATSHRNSTGPMRLRVRSDTFERRWQVATEDIAPMLVPVPLRDPLVGLIGGLPQDALQVTQVEPPRDPSRV